MGFQELKIDQPTWKPAKNTYVDTFFAEHKSVVDSFCQNPEMEPAAVLVLVHGLVSLIPGTDTRRKVLKDIPKDMLRHEKEFKLMTHRDADEELSLDERSHCIKLAYVDAIGKACDVVARYYHTEGQEQIIGIFGMFGEGADGKPAILAAPEALKTHIKKLKASTVHADEPIGDEE